jgi:hypothetical protein
LAAEALQFRHALLGRELAGVALRAKRVVTALRILPPPPGEEAFAQLILPADLGRPLLPARQLAHDFELELPGERPTSHRSPSPSLSR